MARTPHGETRESVYRFVRERLLAGAPPSLREIQAEFGFRAIETAREHLQELVHEGRLLQRARARPQLSAARDREQGDHQTLVQLVPLLGRVQAGALTTAVEQLEAWIPVHTRHRSEELFALRVRGESMMGAGIMPDDIVIVRRQIRPLRAATSWWRSSTTKPPSSACVKLRANASSFTQKIPPST